MGGYAIVGGQMPVAAGLALAAKYKQEDRLVLCFLGDGALNEGEFHESMNLASIRKLPIIYFCENNLYGMGAAVWETLPLWEEIHKVADAYRMPGKRMDGMNVDEVHRVMLNAVQHVLSGMGPIFLVAQTYRYRGHSLSDPAQYRQRTEVETWLKRDPIARQKQRILSEEMATEEELAAIDQAVMREVEEAVKFASDSPFPEPSDLYRDVYG